jgi:hypothetical protein
VREGNSYTVICSRPVAAEAHTLDFSSSWVSATSITRRHAIIIKDLIIGPKAVQNPSAIGEASNYV